MGRQRRLLSAVRSVRLLMRLRHPRVPAAEVQVLLVGPPALDPCAVLDDVVHGRHEPLDGAGDHQGVPAAVEVAENRATTQGHASHLRSPSSASPRTGRSTRCRSDLRLVATGPLWAIQDETFLGPGDVPVEEPDLPRLPTCRGCRYCRNSAVDNGRASTPGLGCRQRRGTTTRGHSMIRLVPALRCLGPPS
jgi:hypothetical protein